MLVVSANRTSLACRLIEAVNFETDEALLSGESLAVHKDAGAWCDDATAPGDRLNVAFSSSTVTKGRAREMVFATGMNTEIGSIAAALRKTDSRRRPVKRQPDGTAKTHHYAEAWTLTVSDVVGRFLGVNVGNPLQKKLSKLAVLLFWIAVVCAIIVLGANRFSNPPTAAPPSPFPITSPPPPQPSPPQPNLQPHNHKPLSTLSLPISAIVSANQASTTLLPARCFQRPSPRDPDAPGGRRPATSRVGGIRGDAALEGVELCALTETTLRTRG